MCRLRFSLPTKAICGHIKAEHSHACVAVISADGPREMPRTLFNDREALL